MNSKFSISRRTMLKGLGGIVISLPLLEEMFVSKAFAADNAPVRAFNIFFGLGIPTPLQSEGFNGVLEPLQPLSDKLLIMQNVDQVRVDEGGINAHFDGAAGAFTAAPPDGDARAGGASIDQMVKNAMYPDGLPAGVIDTVVAGTYFRRSRPARYIHSWKPDGTAAAQAQESPGELFDRIFGSVPTDPDADTSAREQRLKRSVLDSVVGQYQSLTGPNSKLGTASQARVSEHLDRIREYEMRAFGEQSDTCPEPAEPGASMIPHDGAADPDGEGIDITLTEMVDEWRLLADLYALAIQCDRVRFGALTFLAAGERIRLTGNYEYNGNEIYQFDDSGERGRGGSGGCSHEWWHEFREGNDNTQLRSHVHLKMREVAYFLSRLDGDDALDPNGKTILENSLITISTESGDGRHSDVQRELSGIFHAVTGACGRIKTGEILDVGAEGIDVYNTMLESMGVTDRLGPADRNFNRVEDILA